MADVEVVIKNKNTFVSVEPVGIKRSLSCPGRMERFEDGAEAMNGVDRPVVFEPEESTVCMLYNSVWHGKVVLKNPFDFLVNFELLQGDPVTVFADPEFALPAPECFTFTPSAGEIGSKGECVITVMFNPDQVAHFAQTFRWKLDQPYTVAHGRRRWITSLTFDVCIVKDAQALQGLMQGMQAEQQLSHAIQMELSQISEDDGYENEHLEETRTDIADVAPQSLVTKSVDQILDIQKDLAETRDQSYATEVEGEKGHAGKGVEANAPWDFTTFVPNPWNRVPFLPPVTCDAVSKRLGRLATRTRKRPVEQYWEKQETNRKLGKTELCFRFANGYCWKGSKCNYAHSEEELRERPNMWKTRLCKGGDKCIDPTGLKCPFAHGEEDLRE